MSQDSSDRQIRVTVSEILTDYSVVLRHRGAAVWYGVFSRAPLPYIPFDEIVMSPRHREQLRGYVSRHNNRAEIIKRMTGL